MNDKQKRAVILGLILTTLFLVAGVAFAINDFNFEVSKCKNLGSYRTFNVDAQINAEYDQSCYETLNNPLELVYTIVVYEVIVFFVSIFTVWIPISFLNAVFFDEVLYD